MNNKSVDISDGIKNVNVFNGYVNEDTNEIVITRLKTIESDNSYRLPDKKWISKKKIGTVVESTQTAWALSKKDIYKILYDYYRNKSVELRDTLQTLKSKGQICKKYYFENLTGEK